MLGAIPRVTLAGLALGAPVFGQVLNPAHPAQEGLDGDVSTTIVEARRPVRGSDEDLVGSYGQPRWSTRRLFPSTRIYVRPEGAVALEYWTRVKVPQEGQSTVETMYEIEFGLPHRFQLDLYYVTEKTGSEGALDVSAQQFELRYAFADWGKLWGNPTAYLEYVERNGQSDKIEYKLLLGGMVAPGWYAGSNLVLEHELGGALENEYGLTLGIAHSLLDDELSVGAEVKAALVDEHADRGNFSKELEIGPSLRWRPTPRTHVDLAPLIGIGADSRAADLYLVVGVEL